MTLLAEVTTLGVGGPARRFAEVGSETELVDRMQQCDRDREPVLVLGGGSNVVVAESGFDGTVLQVATRGITVDRVGSDHVQVTMAAGEPWDAVVERAVLEGWSGIEALSGIPGLVGATPLQNVGAYGQEIAHVVTGLRVLDRRSGQVQVLSVADCRFRYRGSCLKDQLDRWVVLTVTFQLDVGGLGEVRFAQVADALGAPIGSQVPVQELRDVVLDLRAAKGMVIDPADPDTRSVGSFFLNPIVDQANVVPDCPQFPEGDQVKLSAAWLIEQAGIHRGWRPDADCPAAVSTKHTLAIVNLGGATATDVLRVATAIRDRVAHVHGVPLEPEPRLIGCALPDR
ncbi:MAG: UDP-N-acetylmuramate dehydrogenase [Actinomycetales bacterium]